MNYNESIAYIDSLSPTTQKPCLERIDAFLAERGKPQDAYKSIHIAGTNGKGSTVAILDCLLREAGYRVGRYTGPHLLRWNERFHVNGRPISDERFAELSTRLRAASTEFGQRHPEFGALTWFEFFTALAFTYFHEENVDIAVVEVGLGGRWDATNVLSSPAACAITSIDLDHTQILGSTVREIAREKAGIVKSGVPMVTAVRGDALEEVVVACREKGATLYHCVTPDMVLQLPPQKAAATRYAYKTRHLELLMDAASSLSLAGKHQRANALVASVALAAAGIKLGFSGSPRQSIKRALASVYWPGRFQYIPELSLVLDGAHNPAGGRALRESLEELFPGSRFFFVLGCFENKDVNGLVRSICRHGDRVIACEAASRRCTYPAGAIADIAEQCNASALTRDSVGEALTEAMSCRRSGEIIVATGSFATIKECMLKLGWHCVEDGFRHTLMDWSHKPAFANAYAL